MTHAQSFAYRIRWLLLIVGALLTLGGLWALFGGWPDTPGEVSGGVAGTPLNVPWGEQPDEALEQNPFISMWSLDTPGFYINAATTLGIILLMQWAFLRPRRGWMPKLSRAGRPMKLSLIAAAFMAMLLTVGFAVTLMEIGGAWKRFASNGIFAVWAVMAVVWLIWAALFFLQYKNTQDRYTWMTRALHRLIGGSFLEVFVATGVYAWNPQKEDECFCARGSYTGLVFGGTVLLWAFGPGLLLLFMRERYRRERLVIDGGGGYCFECGYDLRGSVDAGSTTCPECGEPIHVE